MTIAENVQKIKSEIPDNVILVAATKMNDASRVKEAIAAGVEYCGENRVQEMLEKNAQGAYEGAHLHFIGHLQKNKVKHVVGLAELIQSVDSVELLEAIGREAVKKNIVQDVLLEVNIGAEESKSGFAPEDVYKALETPVEGVRIKGLMAIPPAGNSTPFFAQMQQLFIDIGGKKYDNNSMVFLSMGMTHDYLPAIECGSNMIRVGTGIFGPRNYNPEG